MTNQPFTEPMPPANPPANPQADQADKDESHLQIISILYYVIGGINVASALVFGIGFAISIPAIMEAANAKIGANAALPIVAVLVAAALLTLGLGALLMVAGHAIAKRRRWLLCMVMACLNLGSFPLGTAFGIFAIIVLRRPSVKAMFKASSPA